MLSLHYYALFGWVTAYLLDPLDDIYHQAIGIIELQSYFTRSIANSVKKDKARTALRPVDLLFFTVSLRQLETSMVKIERSGRNLCAFAYDAWKECWVFFFLCS